MLSDVELWSRVKNLEGKTVYTLKWGRPNRIIKVTETNVEIERRVSRIPFFGDTGIYRNYHVLHRDGYLNNDNSNCYYVVWAIILAAVPDEVVEAREGIRLIGYEVSSPSKEINELGTMGKFAVALKIGRERQPELFSEEALRTLSSNDETVSVLPIDIPLTKEIEDFEPKHIEGSMEDHSELLLHDDYPIGDYEEPWHVSQENQGVDLTGTELLAVYLPFHFYPEDHWGVRFFERPVLRFAKKAYYKAKSSYMAGKRGWYLSFDYFIKIIVYSIAKHEFTHYLNELFAYQLELLSGRSVYIPYHYQVYQMTYPRLDCIEETTADYWFFTNPVAMMEPGLRPILRELVSKSVGAYAAAANYNDDSIRNVEDRLASQVNQILVKPRVIPTVWGQLPRPYVQPWTRYENVSWTMTKSAGGILCSKLGHYPVRQTIRVHHR